MSFKRCATIALALLTTLCVSGCGTTTKPTAQPSGFCDRLPVPPATHGHIVAPDFSRWVDDVYILYDCTCPGGKYFGHDDKLCKAS